MNSVYICKIDRATAVVVRFGIVESSLGGMAIGRSLPISQIERQWLSFVGVRSGKKESGLGGVGII